MGRRCGTRTGPVGNSPITYELVGRQYVVFGGVGVLYAWTLPRQP